MFVPQPLTFHHYNTLNVTKTAKASEIRKAYRRLAMDKHPDKGGDEKEFQCIQEAYAVLSDPAKREQYDLVGDGQPLTVTPKLQHQQLILTLEEMYTGGEKEVNISYKSLCLSCGGRGGEGKVCGTCKGSKIVQKGVAIAPGMFQMMRQPCSTCKARGRQITTPCIPCKGAGHLSKTTTSKVIFVPGVLANDEIEVEVDGETIMLHVTPQPHPQYARQGFDLFLKQKIDWVQALTGEDLIVTHLNQTQLRLHPDCCLEQKRYVVKHEGMPIDESYRSRLKLSKSSGDLYIQFDIQWPNKLTEEQKQLLQKHFPYARTPSVGAKDTPLEILKQKPQEVNQCHTQ